MKYVGSVIILCACICFSFFYEMKEKAKIENLKKIHSYITYIRIKIDYFLTPHKKLLSGYKCELVQSLYKSNFTNLTSYFDKETATLLKSFFLSFGHGLKDEEIKLCDYTLFKLNEKITLLEKEIGNKVKIARTLTIFGGSCFILLII